VRSVQLSPRKLIAAVRSVQLSPRKLIAAVRSVQLSPRKLIAAVSSVQLSQRTLIAAISSATASILLVVGLFVLTGHRAAAPRRAAAVRPIKPAPPLTSPFTGERIKSLGPELIFKIDNIVYARPPTGLKHADIVYVLPVEGGLSRIMAVFSSHVPKVVGPVRSARAEDIKLLRQFGRPAFAFSGAKPSLLPLVEHARIVDLYAGIVPGYFRSFNRIAPYNLYADTRLLLAEAKKKNKKNNVSRARDIGFRFGSVQPGGVPTRSYSVSYPAAHFTVRWSLAQQRWLIWMDGVPSYDTEGGRLGGNTVVIQYVFVRPSRFIEWGVKAPYASTVGSGRAVVLRNGRAYHVRWTRPRADGGTTFTLPNGHRMLFAPGQVWVIFAYGPHSMR